MKLKMPTQHSVRDDILHGPLLKPLVRLAIPTVLVLLMNTLLSIAETYFVSSLGVSAIAAASLVVPVIMLMIMVANGGIGGGVSSAIARARGAGRMEDAQSLVWHAIVIGVICGTFFMVAVLSCGPRLYRAMGATGATLSQATLYSNILFSGAIIYWLLMLMQAALRGAGNVKKPARIMMVSVGTALVLSPALIMGWFHLPKMGIAGAGVAQVACNVGALICLLTYMRSPASNLRLRAYPLHAAQFRAILVIGLPSTLNAVMANLSLIALTGAAGIASAAGIAGYGIAARLELLLIPMMFGFGTAVLTLVGTNLGAGNVKRARTAALINTCFIGTIVEIVGLTAALMPAHWIGIFSRDPAVIEIGSHYLRVVGPVYGFIAVTTALYFAGQGARRIIWPIVGGAIRCLSAVLAAISVSVWHVNLLTAFDFVAVGALLSGVVSLMGFWLVRWEGR